MCLHAIIGQRSYQPVAVGKKSAFQGKHGWCNCIYSNLILSSTKVEYRTLGVVHIMRSKILGDSPIIVFTEHLYARDL